MAPRLVPGIFAKGGAALAVPPYGIGLENALSHNVAISPNAPAYTTRYGYVPPYQRTNVTHYARMTDGRTYKRSYTAEVPFRQVVKRGYYPQFVSSPGKNVNATKLSGQDALMYQVLRARGVI